MAKRKTIPKKTQTNVLTSSRRRCCICFALSKDTSEKKGQIAHLDQDNSNNEIDNLAFLCLNHHDEYDSKTSQSKGISEDEVKLYRSQLIRLISTEFPAVEIDTDSSQRRNEREVAEVEHSVINEELPPSDVEVSLSDIDAVLGELQISKAQFYRDLDFVSDLLSRIRDAKLPRTQRRLLSIVIENSDGFTVPRRVIESSAGYDYLSSEFFEEMSVIEYRGFISFSEEMDSEIHLMRGDGELWQFIKYLAERAGISIKDVLDNPSLELLLPCGTLDE